MRTSGNFESVYGAAWDLCNGIGNTPISPVIRLEENEWMLESDLNPSENRLECTLSDFQEYWLEYMRIGETPTELEIEDFISGFKNDDS